MKKKKTLYLGLLSLCLLAVLLFAAPVKAQAAAFRQCSRNTKVGKYYIWTDYESNTVRISSSKSGNGTVLVNAAPGRTLNTGCISNGSTVYYIESGPYNADYSYTGYINRVKTDGKGRVTVGTLKNASSPTAYYKGILYMDVYDKEPGPELHTYHMDTKTGKSKQAIKYACVREQNGPYLLAQPNSGAIGPLDTYIYNCKNGKTVRLTKNGGIAVFISKKVYYSEYTKGGGGPDSVLRVRSCSPSGKGKKTIVRAIKAEWLERITSRYVYYRKMNERTSQWTYYRYDIKKKKAKKISADTYNKQVQG